jgi:hypothetical protein
LSTKHRARKILVASLGVAVVSYCGGRRIDLPPPADASVDSADELPVFPSSDVTTEPPTDASPPWDHLVANLAPPPPDDDAESGT